MKRVLVVILLLISVVGLYGEQEREDDSVQDLEHVERNRGDDSKKDIIPDTGTRNYFGIRFGIGASTLSDVWGTAFSLFDEENQDFPTSSVNYGGQQGNFEFTMFAWLFMHPTVYWEFGLCYRSKGFDYEGEYKDITTRYLSVPLQVKFCDPNNSFYFGFGFDVAVFMGSSNSAIDHSFSPIDLSFIFSIGLNSGSAGSSRVNFDFTFGSSLISVVKSRSLYNVFAALSVGFAFSTTGKGGSTQYKSSSKSSNPFSHYIDR